MLTCRQRWRRAHCGTMPPAPSPSSSKTPAPSESSRTLCTPAASCTLSPDLSTSSPLPELSHIINYSARICSCLSTCYLQSMPAVPDNIYLRVGSAVLCSGDSTSHSVLVWEWGPTLLFTGSVWCCSQLQPLASQNSQGMLSHSAPVLVILCCLLYQ